MSLCIVFGKLELISAVENFDILHWMGTQFNNIISSHMANPKTFSRRGSVCQGRERLKEKEQSCASWEVCLL